MATKRVTIKKQGQSYVISVGGTASHIGKTKADANNKADALRRQIRKPKSYKGY